MSISLGLVDTPVVVVPGESVDIPVTVRNSGDVVEGYDLDVVGMPSTWATFDPPRVSLYPGASQTVTLTVRPPRSSEVRAGELPYGVRVVPSEAPQTATVEEAVLTIAPFSEVTGELRPQVRRARLGARYRLAGVNGGNLEETLTVTAVDSAEQLNFAPRPRPTTLAAGEQYTTVLGVRARRLLWRGTPRHLPFRAVLSDTTGRAVTLDGTLVQQPVLSAWLLKLLALLLALLLLLLALWFGLLRPAVTSAAREAVDEGMAQVATEAEVAASEAAGVAARDAIEQERAAAPPHLRRRRRLPPRVMTAPAGTDSSPPRWCCGPTPGVGVEQLHRAPQPGAADHGFPGGQPAGRHRDPDRDRRRRPGGHLRAGELP